MSLMLSVSFTIAMKEDTIGAKDGMFGADLNQGIFEVSVCPSRPSAINLLFLFVVVFNWLLNHHYF